MCNEEKAVESGSRGVELLGGPQGPRDVSGGNRRRKRHPTPAVPPKAIIFQFSPPKQHSVRFAEEQSTIRGNKVGLEGFKAAMAISPILNDYFADP